MNVGAVILAAGYGTRMKSDLPKVLHPLAGRHMIDWCISAAEHVATGRPVVVVGHGGDQVIKALGDRCHYALQEPLLGTAHALQQSETVLPRDLDLVVVTYGDMPQLRGETLASLVSCMAEPTSADAAFAMLTITRNEAQGFGRIVRDQAGQLLAIVEEVDCTPAQRQIRELNPGIYCFRATWLWENLRKIPVSSKGEYYLTDLVALAVADNRRVLTLPAPADEVDGVNTRVHLSQAESVLRGRICERLMQAGVTIVDPLNTCVDDTVEVGTDTVIWPGSVLQGKTIVGRWAVIGPHSQIVDSIIGDSCRVVYSVVERARMDAGAEVGPFGHLRKGAHLAEGVHMGNFGEVKSSYLGPGTKMGHFSYIGDAQIEANVNIGAGTITCNYDGTRKHRTIIEKDVFIGSDTMLVAPVTIGQGARTGAGSVVTRDVPAGGLVYGVPARARPADETSNDKERE
jgi:bifunctional UDP-N-acetylglucosamine pyrophosphorylase/glucosamine-1-phosphate N-acetyltransferase